MPLTKEQREAKLAELKQKIADHNSQTLKMWLMLFEGGVDVRKNAGYSQGLEEMLRSLSAIYRKESDKLMKPFDRGDYD